MFLAAGVNAKGVHSFGGTPYFLYQYGRKNGLFSGLAEVDHRAYSRYGAWLAWYLGRVALGRERKGFQYANTAIENLWRKEFNCLNTCYMNLSQLYPQSIVDRGNINRWNYIDQTLEQMFSYYFPENYLEARDVEEIIARERSQYRSAKGIIVTSKWAEDSLVKSYSISRDKICIVPRGANISLGSVAYLDKFFSSPSYLSETNDALSLVFVGKDWKRKGLLRLLAGCRIAEEKGAKINLTVVGVDESELDPQVKTPRNTRWLGYFSKGMDDLAYSKLLLENDVGCLLSNAEAGGISLREFHAHGLATISPAVGGAQDFAFGPSTISVPPNLSDGKLADLIFDLFVDRERVFEMKRRSRESWRKFLWQDAVEKIHSFIC